MSFAVGARLGPFEIGAQIEPAGHGEAYSARDHENNRDVAIHVLWTDAGQEPEVRDWFAKHVRASAALTRPTPLEIYLVGADAQAVYVVSEPLSRGPVHSGVRRGFIAWRRPRTLAVVTAAVIVVGLVLWVLRRPERPAMPGRPATTVALLAPEPPTVVSEAAVIPERELEPEPEERDDVARLPADAPVRVPPPAPLMLPTQPTPPAPVVPPAPVAPPAPAVSPALPRAPSTVPESAPLRRPPPVRDDRDTATLMKESSGRATEFDLPGALNLLTAAAGRGDGNAQVSALYLGGLLGAREAFRQGGGPEALAPVHAAITSLAAISKGRPGVADIARLILHAAAAGAQGERDEMRLYIESAVHMESIQRAAGLDGAPLVSASELAADLWLQLHQYDEARRAYAGAAERVGSTLRILSGLALSARRLNDMPGACAAYRKLVDGWGTRPGTPFEIADARDYLRGCAR